MKIFSIEITNLKYKDLLNQITKFEKQNIVFTPNPEILLKIKTDKEFENILKQANFLTSDWIGLYIAYQILDNKYWKFINFLLVPYFFFNLFFRRKYLYEKYWDRICWSDLTKDLLVYAENNWTQIVIKFDYIIFNHEKKEEIFEKIKNSESKIVFSTLWMKKQEENVVETMKNCENIKLWLWVGSSFDYFIGFQKRAPKAWRAIWLEWLYRLITWPRKLERIKRLWRAIFVFIFEVFKEK